MIEVKVTTGWGDKKRILYKGSRRYEVGGTAMPCALTPVSVGREIEAARGLMTALDINSRGERRRMKCHVWGRAEGDVEALLLAPSTPHSAFLRARSGAQRAGPGCSLGKNGGDLLGTNSGGCFLNSRHHTRSDSNLQMPTCLCPGTEGKLSAPSLQTYQAEHHLVLDSKASTWLSAPRGG